MRLTDDERRRLEELSNELARSDPRLARALSGRSRPIPAWRPAVEILIAVALPFAVVGISAAEPLLFAVACIAIVTAAVITLITQYQRLRSRLHPGRGHESLP
jgi:hypothetical protein